MSKHRFSTGASTLWGILKYPIPVYKYWLLNNWHYFTKPKIRAKIIELRSKYDLQ